MRVEAARFIHPNGWKTSDASTLLALVEVKMEKHIIELTTTEAAAVLACILATLSEDRPEGEFDTLTTSLQSAARKIGTSLRVPVILAD